MHVDGRKVQKVGSGEIPGVDVGFGADFQREIGGIWVALLEKWRKRLGNRRLMVELGVLSECPERVEGLILALVFWEGTKRWGFWDVKERKI